MSSPPIGWKPPDEVCFGRNARWITYGQDHCMGGLRGLPGDVWFTVGKVLGNGLVQLTAFGYGQLGKRACRHEPSPYGNGAIYVNWIDIAIWGKTREAA